MKKIIRIIIVLIIILILTCLYKYKVNIKELSIIPNNSSIDKVLDINIIDKYNNMQKIYDNPENEKYYEIDIIIDGVYYYNVGIRAKGTTIYKWLKDHESDMLSFKIKLDYINKNQGYNGITELHLNSQAMDSTGIREYLVYEIYNEMGIDTQKYSLANFKIDNKSLGVYTVVEVITEEYVEYKYNSTEGNLYKPANNEFIGVWGSELVYRDDEIASYSAIFENVKTENTDDEDKKRLILIIKKLNEAKTIEEIEACFMDFDKVLKIFALNKVVSNVDGVIGRTMRNYYIYEENGKIDILVFDFNLSLGLRPKEYFFSEEDVKTLGLIEYDYGLHSKLVDIVVENEVFLNRYYEHVKNILNKIKMMNINIIIDDIDKNIRNIVKNDMNPYYSLEEYENGILDLKNFFKNRLEIKM